MQFIADADTTAGAQHVKFKLSKSGETIGLFSSAGLLITANTFGAQLPGVSQGRFPDGGTNVVSFAATASPGSGNYLPVANVVVNEVLSHTDPPLEDAVEFYNSGGLPVSIGGWFLSNSRDALKKYRVPDGTTVPAHGFAVIYEYQFNSPGTAVTPFTFNSAHGDQVWLSEASASGDLTGYRATVDFGASANGVSFGRITNSIGQVDFVALDALTFGSGIPASLEQFRTGTGAPNGYPRIGPVIFNEIMFYPPLTGIEDNTQDEYLELLNISPYTVALFDPGAPTNTWKVAGGVDYVFPSGVSLAPGELLLLVNFDPVADAAALAEFRGRYQVGSGARLFGPYGGHLANGGETLGLYRPDAPQAAPHPDAGFVPYILVEQVTYQPAAPWPAGADGSGLSLQRKVPADYGNDPAHWFVANATAGLSNISNPLDADNDGLPDAWETQYFGSIDDPRATPGADPDGDGFNNLQEYLAGTDPTDTSSALKLDSLRLTAGGMEVKFTAVAGKTYTLLGRSGAAPGSWFKLADVPSQAQTGSVTILDTDFASVPTRYYELVTPALR